MCTYADAVCINQAEGGAWMATRYDGQHFIPVSAKWVWPGPVVVISDLFMDAVYEVPIHPKT